MKKKLARLRAKFATLPFHYKMAIVGAYIAATFAPFPGPTPALTAYLSRKLLDGSGDGDS